MPISKQDTDLLQRFAVALTSAMTVGEFPFSLRPDALVGIQFGRIGYDGREKEPAEKVGRRNN